MSQMPLEMQVPRQSEERARINAVLRLVWPRRGREAAISMHEIARELGIDTRAVQAIVKFLAEERRLPIGTSPTKPYGYFRIVTAAERKAVRGHFIRRALSNLEHAKAYDHEEIVGPLIGEIQRSFPEVTADEGRKQEI